jgi:CDGSH-type Zn-finger protein
MASTKITVNSNGSLKVEGDFEIVDKEGTVYDLGGRTVVSICRCGGRKTKPFCDASHKGHFEHEAVAFALPRRKWCNLFGEQTEKSAGGNHMDRVIFY